MQDFPQPALKHSLQLLVEFGEPARIGRLATGGVRRQYPVLGGTLKGEGLEARLLPGQGGEIWLDRADNSAVVEACYLARSDSGYLVRLIGTGYATRAPQYAGTQLSLLMEADEDGPLAWLAMRVFVARRDLGSHSFEIAVIE